MAHDSGSDSYSPSLPSLRTASSESSFVSDSDNDSTNPNMPGLLPPESSYDGASAIGSEGGEGADSDGGHGIAREGVQALDAYARIDGAEVPQSSIADREQGRTSSGTVERTGRTLRATALAGVFTSRSLDERDDAPPAGSAQGEQMESFLNPVSAEFLEIGRELFDIGREMRLLEQAERRLLERAMQLARANPRMRNGGQESELSDEEGEETQD